MNLRMDWSVGDSYQNESQKIRVITESWVHNNMFCPYCGDAYIRPFENNKPVGDFYCRKCVEQYELKSKNGTMTEKVVDGAYGTMISRIESVHNPNFLFIHYSKSDFQVKDLLLVPKHFFSKSMIEERKLGCIVVDHEVQTPDHLPVDIFSGEIEEMQKKISKSLSVMVRLGEDTVCLNILV